MRSTRRLNVALFSGVACGAFGAVPAFAQETIDGGQTVSVPGTQASPWDIPDLLTVGSSSEGTLAITSGGTVTSNQGQLGADLGSSGTVTVTGPDANWVVSSDLVVGQYGQGTLAIAGGGVVDSSYGHIARQVGSTGTVAVTGTGSTWTTHTNALVVGLYVGEAGNGTLAIYDGGTVSTADVHIGSAAASGGTLYIEGGSLRSTRSYIGYAAGSSGAATVTGPGSAWTTTGNIFVGTSGSGSLAASDLASITTVTFEVGSLVGSTGVARISDGATLTTTRGTFIGEKGQGELIVEGGGRLVNITPNYGDGYIAHSAGSTGTARITGPGSSWENNAFLMVGANGAGTLLVEGGAAVTSGFGVVGYAAGSSGTATLTGGGSSWTSGDSINIGYEGAGTLSILDRATVSDTFSIIGNTASASGTVTVDDASWINSGNFYVGHTGTGALTVSGGGTVSNALGIVGYVSGSSGTVTVTDAGSSWTNSGQLHIGRGDEGALSILNGATVTSGAGFVGLDATGTGTVTIDGAGSAWSSNDNLLVGNHGEGTLTVTGGGAVENAITFIAAYGGSSGTASVSGPGSSWVMSGMLHASYQGTGALSISEAGRVTAQGGVTVAAISGSTGTLGIASGGSLETSALAAGSGAAQVVFDGGRLVALSDNLSFITGFAENTLDITSGGLTLDTASYMVATDQSSFSGVGALTKSGSGTLILAGDNSYTGGSIIDEGTLQIGNGGPTGSITGDVIDNGVLRFDRSDAITFSGRISGSGVVTQVGAGTLTLTGDSSGFGGTSSVEGGALMADGSLGGTVDVASGAALGGIGMVGGITTIASDGMLIGRQGEILRFGSDLILADGAVVDVSLGSPGTVGLFDVAGSLTLDGQLDITDLGGFGPGLYRLFDYAGALADNGLAIGTVPAGSTASDLLVQTSVAQQVNLVNTSGLTLNYWDGDDTGLHNNGAVNGGDGVWNLANSNWTDSGGAIDAPWANGGFAIFAGQAGTVTVDASLGALTISGAQFATGGYRIQGDAVTLALPLTTLRVGIGARSGIGVTATIASELTGSGGLQKTDFGTLILTRANSYTGGTFIDEGTLRLGDGGGTGSILGDVANNGTFAIDRSDNFTFDGIISGTGSFHQAGTGTTILTADNSYTGGTMIASGTLQIGNGGTTGGVTGDVVNNAAFVFNRSGTLTLDGAISGTGNVTQSGAGVTILTGDSSYTGGTAIAAGTLQIGNGGTTGSIIGDIANNAALVFDRSGTLALGGMISGTGNVTQAGIGTTILAGSNSYTGGTTIAAGMLQLGDGGTAGSITGDVVNNGALIFRRSNLYTFAGTISATGSVVQAGTGTTVLTAANSYSGGTLLQGGALSVTSDANLGAAAGGLTFDGGTLQNTAAFSSGRGVTLAVGGGTFQTDADLTLSGTASGNGALTKMGGGTLILTGTNGYTGGTTITSGTLQLGNGGASGTIVGDVANSGTLAFNGSDTLTLAGGISGSGSLIQRGTGNTALTGTNSYTGATLVEAGTLMLGVSSAVATGPVSVAAGASYALDFSSDPASFRFENALSGAGLMRVDLGDPTSFLVFGSNVGSAFTGTVTLGRSSFDLEGDNSAVLANATLRLDAGNTTLVGTDNQAIENLTLNGGTLVFPAELPSDTVSAGTIQTGALTLIGGTITVTVPQPANVPARGLATGASLLQQDDTVAVRLVQANSVVGSASSLTLVDQNGSVVGQADIGIAQSGNVVAIGSYGYNLTTGLEDDGLYVAYGLSRLDLQSGQTLTLLGDDGTGAGSDLHALVAGSGNLAIAATNSIALSNTANNYTGTTRVLTGTLMLGNDHALGLTSLLAIDAGAAADINGRTQVVGALDVRGTLALEGGNVTIANGGTAAGTLTGGGSLNLTGGTLAVDGANAQLSANIAIAPGATAVLTNTQGLGMGAIVDAGTLTLAGASGTLANALSGAGTVGLTDAASVALGGNNTGFSGVFAIAQGSSLSASLPQHLGGAAIQDIGGLIIDTDTDWALANRVAGTGSLTKQGSGILTITTNETYSGGTMVAGGTLIVGTPTSTGAALSGGGDTYVAAGATLGGYGRVDGTVTNHGTIAVADALASFAGEAKGAFTINGALVNNALAQIGGSGTGNRLIVSNYAGGGGSLIAINAELGDDSSPSDMLVIDGGTASGHSGLRITNVGGDGALTIRDGIRVVDAVNGATTTASVFSLASPVVAGPYEYSLHRGGLGVQGEDWYLRSDLDCSLDPGSVPCLSTEEQNAPDYRREDSLYAALPSLTLLYGSELIATFHERSGMRSQQTSDSTGEPRNIWGRVIGAHEKHDGDPLGIYGSGPEFDYDSVAFQVGVYFAYGQLDGDVDHYTGGFAGDAHIEAYTIGHYWTHVGVSGWYIDNVIQGTHYDLKASSSRGLDDLKTDGQGLAASLEGGYPVELSSNWVLEPQAQIVFQRVWLDSASDGASTVRFRDVQSLAGRVGLRLSHDFAMNANAADSGRGTWWLRADLWHEFENDPVTRFSSEDGPVDLDNDLGGFQLKLTTAVSAQVAKGVNFYASGNVRYRLDGDSLGYQGSAGLKIPF
jgi:fibronectin-binding autotransporter adhesin